MVVDCIQAHCTMTADGSKSFLLLLASLLRRIYAHSKARREVSNAQARHLANQLLHLCYDGLDGIIMRQVTPYVSSLYSIYHGDTLEGLVCGYMTGRVGIGQAEVLMPIICDFFWKWNVGQDMAETIRFIHTHFPLLYATVLGLPIGQSCVREGFLLGCDWTVLFERTSKEPIRVLVLNESVFAEDEAVSVFENYVGNGHATTVRRLCVCAEELGVCVLLSPVKCPDLLLQQARQKQLCLAECVDLPLLNLLCQLGQSRSAPVGRVATVTSVSRVVLGGHRFACVGVMPTLTSHTHTPSEHMLHPHTLLLCAPGPGPLDQCVNVCQGVFTMLRSVCEDGHTLTLPGQPHDSHPNQTEDTSLQTVQSHPSTDKSKGLLPPPSDLCHQFLRAGRVVPVGGVFEVLFSHSLLSTDWVVEPQVRSLLAESVLCVPRTLHSHKPCLFLQFQASVLNKLRSSTSPKPWTGELESVSCKQQLLASVLQCVCKLLCVDQVLYTHTPLNTHSQTAETSDDEKNNED